MNKRMLLTGILLIVLMLGLAACDEIYVRLNYETNGGEPIPYENVVQGYVFDALPEPEKEGHTFIGWYEDEALTEPFDSEKPLNRNRTIYAKWSVNRYQLTLVDVDEGVYDERTLDFGALLELPELERDGHEFDAWYSDGTLIEEFEGTNMPAEDLTLYFAFDPFLYTVDFYVGTEIIQSREVAHGQELVLIPDVPEVEGKVGSWSVTDFSRITGDMEVIAVYEDKTYDVVIKDEWGTIYSEQTVTHGALIDVPEEPSREGYAFIGYSEDLLTFVVTEDAEILVVYQILVFTVDFYDHNGVLLASLDVEYGSNPVAPDVHVEEGYLFEAWDTDYSEVTTDLEVRAIIVPIVYSITFDAGEGAFADGESLRVLNADYESVIGQQEEPTLADHAFAGWYENEDYSGSSVSFGPQSTMMLGGADLYAKYVPLIDASGSYVFERENLETGAIESDGDPIPYSFGDVADDPLFTPIVEFEGYAFDYFIAADTIYHDPDDFHLLEDMIDVDVHYTRLILSVTFVQDPSSAGGSGDVIEEEHLLYYNDSYTGDLPEILIGDEDYQARWDRTNLTNLKESVIVRAVYYVSRIQTITFVDGGAIKYIASKTQGSGDQVVTEDSLIWQLDKPGHVFLGWFDQPDGGTKYGIDDMLFSSFEHSNTVYAQWEVLEAFAQPTNLVISSEDGLVISWVIDPAEINGAGPLDYQFLIDGVGYVVDSTDVVVDGNMHVLSIPEGHALYPSFSTLLEPGIHGVSLRARGDDVHHLTGPYSNVVFYSVDTEIEGEVTGVAIYDYFIVEDVEIGGETTKRYIFYTNMTYHFSDRYQFEIIEGRSFLLASDNTLTIGDEPGNFRFEMTVDDEETYLYEGRVVSNIKQFGFGSSISTYLSESTGDNYLDTTGEPYYVGYRNAFELDFRINDNQGERVELEDVLLDYVFYLEDEATPLEGNELLEYVAFENNMMQFTPEAEGLTFTLRVSPRYQANLMQVSDLEFTFSVNDAYNAFDNTELRSLYSNLDVHAINIHRNIEAELALIQMNEDGSPINLRGNPATNTYYGNVYGRLDDGTSEDEIVIHGNYMTIDGSELPKMNADSGSGTLGYAQSFEIINVQTGIFYYDVFDAEKPGLNDNSLSIRNLTVIGNTITPSINYGLSAEEIASQEQLMSENSGGYNGIIVRNGSSHFENIRVGFTLIAFTDNAYGTKDEVLDEPVYMDIDYVEVYDSWANSVYLHGGTGISITNSLIGQSGGAAIHFVDNKQGDGIANPTLFIDNETVINNWISGEEGWFKAYAMSLVALQLKSSIEQNIAPLGKSIIRDIVNPISGLPSQMINFIMLTEPSKGALDDELNPTTGAEVRISLTDELGLETIERPFDFLSAPTDPRVMDGNFLFPVGSLSETDAFMQAVGEAMGYGLSQQEAVNIAYLAGFYNLTVYEALQVAGSGMDYADAVDLIMGADHPMPRYLEVLAQVPIFTAGFSVVVVEVFNQEG